MLGKFIGMTVFILGLLANFLAEDYQWWYLWLPISGLATYIIATIERESR